MGQSHARLPPGAPPLGRAGRCAAAAALVAAAGCERDPVSPGAGTRLDPAWVTGAAARAHDPTSGLFILPDPPHRYVSRVAAESVAVAVARFYGSPNLLGNGRAVLEEQRGGPVAFRTLRPCGRATYALNGYGEPPPGAPGALLRHLGPQWAVPLCAPGVPGAQLSVGVPDGPRFLQVAGTELVGWQPFGGGNDFSAVGVPARFPAGLPLTPEAAVAYAARTTGRRVAAVPAAYDFHGPNYPLCAGWRLTLDAPARLVGDSTGRPYEAATVYVRPPGACFAAGARLYVPLAEQPGSVWFLARRDTTARADGVSFDTLAVSVAGPVRFEPATLRP